MGSWKVTSLVSVGGAGNCRKTGSDSPAFSAGKLVVVRGRPSVSRST
ncbi:hypothetical protein SFUMM280S_03869 [Streptomyces fumanus]